MNQPPNSSEQPSIPPTPEELARVQQRPGKAEQRLIGHKKEGHVLPADTQSSPGAGVPLTEHLIRKAEERVSALMDGTTQNPASVEVSFTARQRRVWVLSVTTDSPEQLAALLSHIGDYVLARGLNPLVDEESHRLTLAGQRHRLNGVTALIISEYQSAQISLVRQEDFDALLEGSSLGSPRVKATLAEPNPNPPRLEG